MKEQAQMIFNSPYFLERVSIKTNLTIPEIKNFFSNEFWKETNPGELNHLYKELFEKIILKEDQIVYEVKTSGVQALIEGVTNECE